jgi:hypothetical protein
VIFNLFAVPIVLLVGALGAGLVWLLPGVFGGPYEEITYSVLAVLIGGLGELIGIRARLFFLPVWLIGGALLAWRFWTLFGVLGLVAGGALLGLLLLAFVATIVWSMWASEKEMPEKLEEARRLLADGKVILAKPVLADAWVMPSFRALTPTHAQALREVLTLIEQHAEGLAIRGYGPRLVEGVRLLLERAVQGNLSYGFLSDEAALIAEVSEMLRAPETWALSPDAQTTLAKLTG